MDCGMSRTPECRLAMDALNMAISKRGAALAFMHSDQGSTYTGSHIALCSAGTRSDKT